MAELEPQQRPRIARRVHRIDPGEGAGSARHEAHWRAWQRQLPGWEFRTWRAADLATLPAAGLIARAEGSTRQAQIACYAILHAHGGLWLAPGMMPYFPLQPGWDEEELLVCSAVDDSTVCSLDFVAAAPGARALGWALDTIAASEMGKRAPSLETGPFLLARALAHGPHRRLASQHCYPYAQDELASALYLRDLAPCHAICLWDAPQPAGNAVLAHTLACIERGDLRAASESLGQGHTYTGKPLREAIEAARNQRTLLLEAAKGKLASSRARVDDPLPLAMLKIAFFVMTELPDLLLWQIGAGDGMLADPLRPLVVNFDPHLLLVEPDPASFAALHANYGANTRSQFAQCAYAPEPGRIMLRTLEAGQLPPPLAAQAARFASTTPERVPSRRMQLDGASNGAIAAAMTDLEVDALDVGALLDVNPGIQPGIVVLDTGGSEFAFIEQMLAFDVRPFILQYAHDALAPHETAILNDVLQRDYVLLTQGHDTLAYRSDIFSLYCEHLYVEHGLPTIYRDAFRLLLGF